MAAVQKHVRSQNAVKSQQLTQRFRVKGWGGGNHEAQIPLLPVFLQPFLQFRINPFLCQRAEFPSILPHRFCGESPQINEIGPLHPVFIPYPQNIKRNAGQEKKHQQAPPWMEPQHETGKNVLRIPGQQCSVHIKKGHSPFAQIIRHTPILYSQLSTLNSPSSSLKRPKPRPPKGNRGFEANPEGNKINGSRIPR